VLLVEPGTDLAGLPCRVCGSQLQPGERVLVAYRRGKPSLMHAHLCETPLHSERAAASEGSRGPFRKLED